MDGVLYHYRAKVTDVYDGDTITVDIDLGLGVWMRGQKIRLAGINAPEVRGEERADGKFARDALRDLILDKEIILRTYRDTKGKYGRWLGVVYLGVEDINAQMLERGLAEEVDY